MFGKCCIYKYLYGCCIRLEVEYLFKMDLSL